MTTRFDGPVGDRHATRCPGQGLEVPLHEWIGRAATCALYEELALSPKPGLVTLNDAGSHDDMDARTFLRSIHALRPYFVDIARLGAAGAPLDALEHRGLQAEDEMMQATGGVNTHRGAVFSLGLLCAAVGSIAGLPGMVVDPLAIRTALAVRWGDDLARRARRRSMLPGGIAAARLGLRGASDEAALAFPVLFETAWPAFRRSVVAGLPRHLALMQTLFELMASLQDCNVAHRGGLAGLQFVQRAAGEFIAAGGVRQSDATVRAESIGHAFVRRRLSPGGAADMLAAVCLLDRVMDRPVDR